MFHMDFNTEDPVQQQCVTAKGHAVAKLETPLRSSQSENLAPSYLKDYYTDTVELTERDRLFALMFSWHYVYNRVACFFLLLLLFFFVSKRGEMYSVLGPSPPIGVV